MREETLVVTQRGGVSPASAGKVGPCHAAKPNLRVTSPKVQHRPLGCQHNWRANLAHRPHTKSRVLCQSYFYKVISVQLLLVL